ncbi:MAG: biotin transporter BioY [Christensenellales bacterium]
MKIRQLLICALFAALTAAGAVFIKVPVPGTMLIFTFQTFFVFLSGFLLTPKYALISQLVYIAIGLLGLPVFSKGGGLWYIFEPSFGFLPGFALCAFFISALIRKTIAERLTAKSLLKISVYALVCIASMYAAGIGYMYAVLNLYIKTPVTLGYVIVSATGIYFFFDAIKFIMALLLGMAVLKRMPNKALW